MKSITLRKIRLSDSRIIASICRTSWIQRYSTFFPKREMTCETESYVERWFKRKLISKKYFGYIAILNTEPIGVCLLCREKIGYLLLDVLFVSDEHQKKGAGSILFKAAQSYSKRHHMILELHCAKDNYISRKWYESLGGELVLRGKGLIWTRCRFPCVKYRYFNVNTN